MIMCTNNSGLVFYIPQLLFSLILLFECFLIQDLPVVSLTLLVTQQQVLTNMFYIY